MHSPFRSSLSPETRRSQSQPPPPFATTTTALNNHHHRFEGTPKRSSLLPRTRKYTDYDAKGVLIQMLIVVAFCHLQGVVHRDLKPEFHNVKLAKFQMQLYVTMQKS
ncbi:calcium-dependent protein kinase 18-like [Helianthus annuus]|uniref:calcium-dependent protein kinase 18-like n=1 Tax=Helianthus annuus TaxID=4232 RepID=UPI0016530159|nr:calcium-dependent protein kinase 18-like [Helianthus annuus]